MDKLQLQYFSKLSLHKINEPVHQSRQSIRAFLLPASFYITVKTIKSVNTKKIKSVDFFDNKIPVQWYLLEQKWRQDKTTNFQLEKDFKRILGLYVEVYYCSQSFRAFCSKTVLNYCQEFVQNFPLKARDGSILYDFLTLLSTGGGGGGGGGFYPTPPNYRLRL